MLVVVAGGFDRDTTRLHRLRHFPNQSDLQYAVFESRIPDLDIVRQVKNAAERPQGDSLVEVVAITLVGLAALDGKRRLLGRDGDLLRAEARQRQRDLVLVLAVRAMSFSG